MREKIAFFLTMLLLFSSILYFRGNEVKVVAPTGYPVHNLDTGLNYTSIQGAIDANDTLDGHTIFVEEGTYYEHVTVSKSLMLLGENKETTLIDGNMTGHVVSITKDHVNVTGFTIQRSGLSLFNSGISLSSTEYCDISGNRIVNNSIGIYGSPKNTCMSSNTIKNNTIGVAIDPGATSNIISRNRLMANTVSIHIYYANSNNISENNITSNWRSITLGYSSSNRFYHNNFFNNTEQVLILASGYANIWDDDYPSGGNYWSNYTILDLDNDGIGDTEISLDVNNTDHYPLMGMFSSFNIASVYRMQTISNSTVSDPSYNGTAIFFDVTGENSTNGFCRLSIPTALMNEPYRIFVNGTEVSPTLLPISNSTHSYIYFTYPHSTKEVVIIPEFPSLLILPLFLMVTLVVAVLHKRKMELD